MQSAQTATLVARVAIVFFFMAAFLKQRFATLASRLK
jgi:hypothetical protein